jgi:hypothetical protein
MKVEKPFLLGCAIVTAAGGVGVEKSPFEGRDVIGPRIPFAEAPLTPFFTPREVRGCFQRALFHFSDFSENL